MRIKEGIKLNHLGQFVRDDEPEEKFGVYIDGKLHNAYWGERPAKNVADYMQRLHPEKTITVKAIFGEENNNKEINEVTPALQPGSKIRTKGKGTEGEVTGIENGIVHFRLADGRMMRTSERNVIPVEKLQDGGMGGINRSAPANDVSYEHVLDEIMDRYMQTNIDHQGEERRSGPQPEPVLGLNREKAEKIAKEMGIRLKDTIYIYKLVKGMINLDEVPSMVRIAIYKLFSPEHGMPIDKLGSLKPYVMDKLREVVSEEMIREEIKQKWLKEQGPFSGIYKPEPPKEKTSER